MTTENNTDITNAIISFSLNGVVTPEQRSEFFEQFERNGWQRSDVIDSTFTRAYSGYLPRNGVLGAIKLQLNGVPWSLGFDSCSFILQVGNAAPEQATC